MYIVCSYINERNRQRNVTRAEMALKVREEQWLDGEVVELTKIKGGK